MILSANRFKETCQRVYFPVSGYSLGDFIVVNGGMMCILQNASESDLKLFDIDPSSVAESIAMCEDNVMSAIEKLSPLFEQSVSNLEALLFAARTPRSTKE